jgi:hypothetical protein
MRGPLFALAAISAFRSRPQRIWAQLFDRALNKMWSTFVEGRCRWCNAAARSARRDRSCPVRKRDALLRMNDRLVSVRFYEKLPPFIGQWEVARVVPRLRTVETGRALASCGPIAQANRFRTCAGDRFCVEKLGADLHSSDEG